jgi:hypothetical protein
MKKEIKNRGGKGQLFILAAFFIYLVIADVANMNFYTSMPAESAQALANPASEIVQTIKAEIVYSKIIGSDFLQFAGNFSAEKNFALKISSTDGGAAHSSTCDYFANATKKTFTNYTDYTVNATSNYGDVSVVSSFRVCWK